MTAQADSLVAVADKLYGLDPGEFTQARDQHARKARQDGEPDAAKTIRSWRRPTTTAWLVNLLVRQRGEQIDSLLHLGESMRAAQDALAGGELRRLSPQRRQVIYALAQEAAKIAAGSGRPVGSGVERELQETLSAALSDAGAAAAVRTGRLLKALSADGLDRIDLSDAVTLPTESTPGRPRPVTTKRAKQTDRDDLGEAEQARITEARAAAEHAETAVREAKTAVQEAERLVSAAEGTLTAATDRRDECRTQVSALEDALEQARHAERAAEQERRDAQRAREAADREAQDARRRLAVAESGLRQV